MGTSKIIWGQVIRKALHCKHWPRGVQMSKFTAAELYKSTETWEQSQIQVSCLLLFKANGLRAMHLRLWASPCERSMWVKNKGHCNILALWQACLNNMKKLVKWVYIQNHNIWQTPPNHCQLHCWHQSLHKYKDFIYFHTAEPLLFIVCT